MRAELEFLQEIATALASIVLRVDAFDEPNVTEAKRATQEALERYHADGRFPDSAALADRDGIRVEAPDPMVARLRSA